MIKNGHIILITQNLKKSNTFLDEKPIYKNHLSKFKCDWANSCPNMGTISKKSTYRLYLSPLFLTLYNNSILETNDKNYKNISNNNHTKSIDNDINDNINNNNFADNINGNNYAINENHDIKENNDINGMIRYSSEGFVLDAMESSQNFSNFDQKTLQNSRSNSEENYQPARVNRDKYKNIYGIIYSRLDQRLLR